MTNQKTTDEFADLIPLTIEAAAIKEPAFANKYVITMAGGGIETPTLLAPWKQHSDVVKPGEKVISAGFYKPMVVDGIIRVKVWGGSVSLGVASRDEDADEIAGLFI